MTDVLHSHLLWYLNRSTGVVLVAVLTVSTALGILSASGAGSRWPRFARQGLHRNVSLIACAWWLAPWFTRWGIEPIYSLAVGVMLGGVLQLAVQVPALRCARPGSRTYIHTGDRLASEPKPVVVDVALELASWRSASSGV